MNVNFAIAGKMKTTASIPTIAGRAPMLRVEGRALKIEVDDR